MEPSLIGWEWKRGVKVTTADKAAAMEPSLIGWEWRMEDLVLFCTPAVPQWSPALSAGNGCRSWRGCCMSRRGRNGAQPYRLGMGPPPISGPNTCTCRNGAQPYRLGMARHLGYLRNAIFAAMEPSLIGWEWWFARPEATILELAAMEPSLIGWEWAKLAETRARHGEAAMEPSLIGWEW